MTRKQIEQYGKRQGLIGKDLRDWIKYVTMRENGVPKSEALKAVGGSLVEKIFKNSR